MSYHIEVLGRNDQWRRYTKNPLATAQEADALAVEIAVNASADRDRVRVVPFEAAQRERHLDKLADAFFEHLAMREDESIGLDGKRPFGFRGVAGSVLGIIDEVPEGPDETWSDAQIEYGDELFGDLAEHLKRRWAGFRARENGT